MTIGPLTFERRETFVDDARTIWTLAWPAVALNILGVINGLLDRGFIGHLETAASTALGGTLSVVFLLFSIAMCFATAATALVSRAFGAKDMAEVQKGAHQTVTVSFLAGIVLALVGFFGSPIAAKFLLPADDLHARHLMTQCFRSVCRLSSSFRP